MSAKIGIRAWIDFAFRKIFGKPGNEICLISLLNAVLDLPEQVVAVEFLNPFSFKDFANDKLVCVDVKATDDRGRVFIVEVQIVVPASFAKRAAYYACKAYADQLQAGQGYGTLKATYSVCLLMRNLWPDAELHHHFRLVEQTTAEVLHDAIEIHTVELAKYNGTVQEVRGASALEQWCYWIKNAGEHTAEELRELLPSLAFLRATSELIAIQEITEEKAMYDSREKAVLDIESNLIDAREEGIEKGRSEGEWIGKLRLLQELLGEQVSTVEELAQWSEERIAATLTALQAKLQMRLS